MSDQPPNPHLNHDHDDGADRLIDENLRAAMPRLDAAPRPNAQTVASWRTPASLPIAHAKRRPRLRWWAAGSAVAATIAFTTALLTITAGSSVQAGTIIDQLRQKQIRGVDIALNALSAQGVTVNGHLQMRSRESIRVDQLAERDPFGPEEFGAMHGTVSITTDATADFPNASINAEAAFTDHSGWVYLHASDGTIQAMQQQAPQMAFMVQMLRSGLVLNIGAITPELLQRIGPHDPPPEVLDDLTDEQIASINNASENFEKATGQAHKRLNAQTDADGQRRVTVSLGMQANDKGSAPVIRVDPGDGRASAAAMRLLNGTARRTELEQLTGFLKNANQNATVRDLGAGRYLLTAELTDPANPPAPGTSRRDGTLTVMYEEHGGVQWAEITDLREASGSIRITFVDNDIDPAQLEYKRLVEPGVTGFIDLSAMLRLMGG